MGTHTFDQIQMVQKIYRTYTDNSGRKLVREIHTTPIISIENLKNKQDNIIKEAENINPSKL